MMNNKTMIDSINDIKDNKLDFDLIKKMSNEPNTKGTAG
tara:strand:- start:4666 stop:4782 length:117 start_codon:yes stop_codon:yes gene_type:complete